MALLHIAEPGLSAAPASAKMGGRHRFRTTNSLVAVVRSGVAETLADASGRDILPSVVRYLPDELQIGTEAKKLPQKTR